jgi:hypothetical protein
VFLILISAGCRDRTPAPAAGRTPTGPWRDAAQAAARLWSMPDTPPGSADFSVNTPGSGTIDASADVDCDFALKVESGTTPKFHCTMPDGSVIKVKYGATNPEVPAEVAASRLMAALGFAVDPQMLVHSVRCRGCPPLPALALECLKKGAPASACLDGASPTGVRTFTDVMIERPFAGSRIEDTPDQGWAWFELDKIDPAHGGATRTEVDALRLMAVLLAHWDNKAENQRLVCPPGQERSGSCAAPVAVVHDLGATFGPLKADLVNWTGVPIWADARACRVSMETLPFKGGTFPPHRISEEGRALAVRLLRTITPGQLDTLFASSGFGHFPNIASAAHDPHAWTEVFVAKVDRMAEGGPCLPAAELQARGE